MLKIEILAIPCCTLDGLLHPPCIFRMNTFENKL